MEPITTLPRLLRCIGDLWGARALTSGHTMTWEDAQKTNDCESREKAPQRRLTAGERLSSCHLNQSNRINSSGAAGREKYLSPH